MKRLYAFVLVIVLVTLACGSQQSAIQTAIVATKAYEGDLATALAGTLAAGAVPTQAAPVDVAATTVLTATAALEPTATVPVIPPPVPNAKVLEYGQTLSVLPRQETLLYTFTGTRDEGVLVRVIVSNVSKHPFCDGRRLTSNWSLKTNDFALIDPTGLGAGGGTTQIYTLPYTGRYYISASCNGGGCDGFCAQLDVYIEKK